MPSLIEGLHNSCVAHPSHFAGSKLVTNFDSNALFHVFTRGNVRHTSSRGIISNVFCVPGGNIYHHRVAVSVIRRQEGRRRHVETDKKRIKPVWSVALSISCGRRWALLRPNEESPRHPPIRFWRRGKGGGADRQLPFYSRYPSGNSLELEILSYDASLMHKSSRHC